MDNDDFRPIGPETPGATSESGSPTAHLDAIDVGDGPAGAGPELAPGYLSRDQFRAGFGVMFKLAGSITGLRTLLEAPERPESGPAADAVYDIAREVPWLSWLIQPQGVWFQRGIALGAFAIPLAAGVSAELGERRRTAATPTTDEPPDFDELARRAA